MLIKYSFSDYNVWKWVLEYFSTERVVNIWSYNNIETKFNRSTQIIMFIK